MTAVTFDVAVIDQQASPIETLWLRDLELVEALKISAYWRSVPGYAAFTYHAGQPTDTGSAAAPPH